MYNQLRQRYLLTIEWHNKKRPTFGYFLLMLLLCSACLSPYKSFEKTKIPPPPDYAQEKYWAALPTKKDSAHAILHGSGLKNEQANAKVDVFFVHPTSYLFGTKWNASLDNKNINRRTNNESIRQQASIFNGSCKVYAPYYRQAILQAYTDKKGNGPKAFDTAYNDVRAAFEYYLKHYNNGRPFIIASHSQGTDHAFRLIKDYFEKDTMLYKKLVAAYLIGRPLPKQSTTLVVPCDSASQTGCFVTWNTMTWGKAKFFDIHFSNVECVNPLTWKRDTVYAPASLNKGAVPFTFKQVDKAIADAKCTENGLLWVHSPKASGYISINGSYHVMDFSLYNINIRENVKERVDAYFRRSK